MRGPNDNMDRLYERCMAEPGEMHKAFENFNECTEKTYQAFKEIMEVRPGRKDLKLVTSDSMHPFVTIDFGALPINPETGNKYMDEIADRLAKIVE